MKKLLLIYVFCPLLTNAQIITTIAGDGTGGYNGDGISATTAQLYFPGTLALDKNNNVYVADKNNNRIRKITAATGIITTVIGNGLSCADSVGEFLTGVPATTIPVGQPYYVATDDSGNLYTNCYLDSVRKTEASTGIINEFTYIIALDVIIDDTGNLYITGELPSVPGLRIYKRSAITGIISLYAGNGTGGDSGDGGPATAAEFSDPSGLALDNSGNLYFATPAHNKIKKIEASTGIITTIAGSGSIGYSGDGYSALLAEFNTPGGVAVDASGNVYVADGGNNVIRKISSSTGIISTYAGTGIGGYSGDGLPAITAQLNGPTYLKVDSSGNLYIADCYNHRIRKIIPGTTSVTTIPSSSEINIYPNPVTALITITANRKIQNVEIDNLVGQQVYTEKFDSESVEINVKDLPAGIYFAKIDGAEVRKFVKK